MGRKHTGIQQEGNIGMDWLLTVDLLVTKPDPWANDRKST
jgi:hypothetical protein